MIAVTLPLQVAFDGAVNGLTYALIGMGVVLIYRSTKVINFAAGAMGLPGAALISLLVIQYRFPYWLALPIGLLVGVVFGAVAELVVVRRLFNAPRVVLLVATIGLAQLGQAIAISYPEIDDLHQKYPSAISGTLSIGGLHLSPGDQLTVIVVPLIAAVLGIVLTRTRFGKTVTASADNAELARLSGISPKRASTIVWIIGGLLSTVSLTLIATSVGNVNLVTTLGPATMARGLTVAVLAGLVSFPRALTAGIVLGVIEAAVGFNAISSPGLFESVLLIAVIVAVLIQSRNEPTGASTFSFVARTRPVPPQLVGRWWVRHLGAILTVVLMAVAALLPIVFTAPSRSYLFTMILGFALVALSVSIMTGWSGQLSLGQMAFGGIGALVAAAMVRGLSFSVAFLGGSPVRVRLEPMPFIAAILVGTAVASVVAVVLGSGALRVRGLMLAVTTFVFAYAAEGHLFRTGLFTGGKRPPVRLPRGQLGPFGLGEQRVFFWLALVVTVVVVSVVARVKRRGPGRRIMAVRDNADSAAAYTVSPAKTKLVAFALSGGVAGLGGALIGGLVQNIDTNSLFVVNDSLEVVAIAIIGGLGSIAGPFLGAIWVRGLPAFFPDNELVPLFSSSIGLLILLLYLPSGLVQIGYGIRDAFFAWLAPRLADRPDGRGAVSRAGSDATEPTPAVGDDDPEVDPGHPATGVVSGSVGRSGSASESASEPVLVAHDLVVRFGGVRAVDGVDLTVGVGEVVGLIGTNGAGKSTILNAIGGYVRSEGTVTIDGVRIDSMAPHKRAGHGLGRTFQAANVFPNLTVREAVMIALEARHRSSLIVNMVAWPGALRVERSQRSDADEIIGFLGLGAYADVAISALSTGTRRIVELADLLALRSKVLCLDEPTAGVAQRETEAFGPLIGAIRAELDASVLIVEHDMPLIMGMSDRVYCLEAGRVIADGPPEVVRADPLVIASYLGTDERAINRSESATADR